VVNAAASAPSATTAAAIAADTARNQAINAIGSTGRTSASGGSAVSTRVENMVPLSAISRYEPSKTALAVNHQGLFVSTTISFNLKPGQALSDAAAMIQRTIDRIGMPPSIRGSYSGTAATYLQALRTEPILILAALVAIYIVLGILYESTIHPLTILSTLPSAGIGAVLALRLCNLEFSVIALIGVILLIGIVKKNAILMIDVALQAERGGMSAAEAIRTACLLRFRPILMTTLAAAVGALPLTLGIGEGAELRQPLGIAIVGGLLASQLLTLYTTPVVYIYLDGLRLWLKREHGLWPATWTRRQA
jgi:multidrug efflux pump